MIKWEYLSTNLNPDYQYEVALNRHGELGWELVSRGEIKYYRDIDGYSSCSQEHLFKRPLEKKDKSQCRNRCGDPSRCGGC